MKYCSYCGNELDENDNFCNSCGKPVKQSKKDKLKENFNDEIKDKPKEEKESKEILKDKKKNKCPNCGSFLKSFESHCEYCGYELRNVETSKSLKKFSEGLEKLNGKRLPKFEPKDSILKNITGKGYKEDEEREDFIEAAREEKNKEKASYIRNYPVPNSKEDILEFMISIVSNINLDDDDIIIKSWSDKLEQVYLKAKIIIKNTDDLLEIENIYNECKKEIKKKKRQDYIIFAYIIGYLLLMILVLLSLASGVFTFIGLIILLLGVCLFLFYIFKGKNIEWLKNKTKIIYIICAILVLLSGIFFYISHYQNHIDESNYYSEDVKKYNVEINIEFESNIIFNRYDVELSAYDQKVVLLHGKNKIVNFNLPNGTHTLNFKNVEDSTVDSIELTVKGNTKVNYKISCHSDEIKIIEMDIKYLDESDNSDKAE